MYTIIVICAQEVAVTSALSSLPSPGSVISFLTWSEVVSFFTDESRLAKIVH